MEFASFRAKLANPAGTFVRDLVDSIYAGDVYVFLNAYDPRALRDLRNNVFAYSRNAPPSMHKMIDGCPDYHTPRDWHAEDHGGGYSSTYHLHHFFRWNGDPLGIFKLFEEPYRMMKLISGLPADAFETHVPSDGPIDRIEISHYPQGVGGIAFHTDPIGNIRFMCTINLSELGVDYQAGGFAAVDQEDHICPVEPMAPLGSIIGFLPSICHGVEIIDPDKPVDWEGNTGRWYVGLSCVDSETIAARAITRPVAGLPTLREQLAMHTGRSNTVARTS